jgi:hypothetical protein
MNPILLAGIGLSSSSMVALGFVAFAALTVGLIGLVCEYEKTQITEVAMNALNAATGVIVDADIAPLTTKEGLIALWVDDGKPWVQGMDVQFHQVSIQAACDADIFTNSNIAAANTMNGLRSLLTTANPLLDNSYQSGFRWWT